MRISDWSSDVCSSDLWSGKRLGPKPSCCAINGALDDPRTWPYSPDPGVRHCRGAGQPSGDRHSEVIANIDESRFPGCTYGGSIPAGRSILMPSELAPLAPLRNEHRQDRKSTRMNYSHYC